MFKLGLIGCGNMGEAIISGLLKAKWATPEEIIISTKTSARSEKMKHDYGVVVSTNTEVAEKAAIIILAVKPNMYREVIQEIVPFLDETKVLVSITPSFSLETLRHLSGGKAQVVRAMPNTPAKVGFGMTGVTFEKETSQDTRQEILTMFSCLGKILEIPEEMMKVVGSLSGSAPAFIELFMKAMVDAGVSYGMSPEDARLLVVQTVLGTAQLAASTQKPFESMIDDVCSKGGSTIRGISSLKENQFEEMIHRAVEKTTERFIEMNQESKVFSEK